MRFGTAVAVVVTFVGCKHSQRAPVASPEPQDAPLGDLVGSWTSNHNEPGEEQALDIRPDGTFAFSIRKASGTCTSTGTVTRRGSDLNLPKLSWVVLRRSCPGDSDPIEGSVTLFPGSITVDHQSYSKSGGPVVPAEEIARTEEIPRGQVSPGDLVGSWHWSDKAGEGQEDLDIGPDGTFAFALHNFSSVCSGSGTFSGLTNQGDNVSWVLIQTNCAYKKKPYDGPVTVFADRLQVDGIDRIYHRVPGPLVSAEQLATAHAIETASTHVAAPRVPRPGETSDADSVFLSPTECWALGSRMCELGLADRDQKVSEKRDLKVEVAQCMDFRNAPASFEVFKICENVRCGNTWKACILKLTKPDFKASCGAILRSCGVRGDYGADSASP